MPRYALWLSRRLWHHSDPLWTCEGMTAAGISMNLQHLSDEKPTWTDYFNDLVRTPLDQRNTVVPINELIDYCIRPTLSTVTPKSTQTLVPLYDLEKPVEALSDHQALLTTWTVKSPSIGHEKTEKDNKNALLNASLTK